MDLLVASRFTAWGSTLKSVDQKRTKVYYKQERFLLHLNGTKYCTIFRPVCLLRTTNLSERGMNDLLQNIFLNLGIIALYALSVSSSLPEFDR